MLNNLCIQTMIDKAIDYVQFELLPIWLFSYHNNKHTNIYKDNKYSILILQRLEKLSGRKLYYELKPIPVKVKNR